MNFFPNVRFWFGLVWFYGIPTIEGYLMPNPVFIYILNAFFRLYFQITLD